MIMILLNRMEKEIKQRKTYDTRIKYLVREGLLPVHYKQQINRSLISKWKKESQEKYIGYELNMDINELYDLMKLVSENERIQKAIRSYYRINKTLKEIIAKGGSYISKLKENKTQVVNAIKQARETITLSKAVKLIGISKSTYRMWAMEMYFKCNHSISKICSNTYPNQLTVKEINKMYRLLSSPKFFHWSVLSLAHWGRKNSILHVHTNTWYKYVRLMNIKRLHYRKVHRKYDIGLRATKPNEKWHADITELQLGNGITYYIYLVVDNFSRYIISWRISHKICATTRLETFKESVDKAKRMKRKRKRSQLIVDGGTENNNKMVESYVKQQQPPLQKLIALKDIERSNAMVEALNKTLKYQYLYPKNIFNLVQLQQVMEWAVSDYNTKRPHGALNGLTPKEAHYGRKYNHKLTLQNMKTARVERVQFNQCHTCTGCPFGCIR